MNLRTENVTKRCLCWPSNKNEAHGAELCDASYLIAKSFRTEPLIPMPSRWQMFNL